MPALFARAACLLCATLALAALPASALANDAPFTPRFAQTARGDVKANGNTLMTCPTTCQSSATADDNDYVMGYVDADGNGTTFDSSSANVTLPVGATVLWAGLYWGADTSQGTGGAVAPNAAAKGTVSFGVPGGAYQQVTALGADVLTSSLQSSRYRAFADVTAQVAAAGSGTYWVANVQAGTGNDRFAGWALVVAYRDGAQPIRRLNVYDGLGTVDNTHSFSTTIAPFHTPATGTVTTKAGLLSFEGDAGITGETASFNGHALTDAANPVNNPMNSTIESSETRNPSYANQLGMDLDVFTNNPGALANDQSSATLAFSSTQEYFMPSAFFLVSDEGPATSTGAGPTITLPAGGVAHDGQTLSANPGAWNGTGQLTYSYQWQQCDANGANCQNIAGATQSTFTPGASNVGGTVRVIVTATNDAGTSAPVVSAPIAVKAATPPANTARPVLSGPAAQGRPLTAGTGSWTSPAGSYSYQWQRCDAGGQNCVDIGGATTSTYTPGIEDVGHTLRAVVTATNDAGSTTTTTTTSAAVSAALDPNDLGSVPGSLVSATSCQQLVGGAKYRRAALAGIGTVRVRAYTNGPARESSPVKLTTEVSGGRATSVRYTLDGRAIATRAGTRHPATLTPAQLGKIGPHTLRTAVRGRSGAPRTVVLKLTTAPCQTLFTAQRWRTTAGAGLRLRIDSRTALTGPSFTVPAALLPRQVAAKRSAGFLRLSIAGRAKPLRLNLSLPKRGMTAVLLRAPDKPTVTRTRGGLVVAGLPARTAVAELTLYRVTKLDGATPRRVYRVAVAVGGVSFSARPAPPR